MLHAGHAFALSFQYNRCWDVPLMVLAGRAFGFTAGEDHERDIQKLRTGGFSDGCAGMKHERGRAVGVWPRVAYVSTLLRSISA